MEVHLQVQLLSPFTESKDNMATTYDKIATTTLGSAASSIDFTSIASSWTDLRIVVVNSSVSTNTNFTLRFNTTTTGYSTTYISGDGTTATSGRTTSQNKITFTSAVGLQTVQPALLEVDIFNYTGSTFKTVLGKLSANYNGSGGTELNVGLWQNTAAITGITILTGTAATYSAGTTATLYGIKAA